MSTRETSPEIASMAGRILAAGNPLDNDQVILAVIEGLADANTGKQAQAALKTMFQPYFDNMLSLAASCLSQAEPDDGENGPRINMTATVDWSKITNAITGSVEGGYSSWMHRLSYERSQPSMNLAEAARGGEHTVWYNDPGFWIGGGVAEVRFDKPDEDEGAGTGRMTIGRADLRRGLSLMAEKAPRHFADLLNENDDATTHDVFMQMVVLGEIVYG